MAGRLKLGQMLVAKELIHPDQLAAALAAQESGGGRLGTTLVQMGAIGEEQLIRVLAQQLGVKVARIGGKTVSAEILALVPHALAEKYRCMPLFLREGQEGDELVLAMEDPSDGEALEALRAHVSCSLYPVLIAPSDLAVSLERYYPAEGDADASATGETLMAAPLAPLPSTAPPHPAPEPAPPEADLGLPPLDGLEDPSLAATAPDEDEDPVLGDSRLGDSLAGASLAGGSALGDSAPGDSLMDIAPPALGDPDASWSSLADDPGLEEASFVGGDPFADFEKEPFADGDAAPIVEEPTDPVAASQPAPRLEADVILQALSQLLVEKGVITREEFAQRLRSLSRRTG